MAPPPDPVSLADELVRLSPYQLADAPTIAAIDADPEVQRWFDWPLTPEASDPSSRPARLARAERTIRLAREKWAAGEELAFIIHALPGGEGAGWIDLQPRSDGSGNVAYGVLPAFRRRGLATHAVVLASAFAFEVLRWPGLEIRVACDNLASRSVARRAGFALERILPGHGSYERHQPFLGRRFDEAIYRRRR